MLTFEMKIVILPPGYLDPEFPVDILTYGLTIINN